MIALAAALLIAFGADRRLRRGRRSPARPRLARTVRRPAALARRRLAEPADARRRRSASADAGRGQPHAVGAGRADGRRTTGDAGRGRPAPAARAAERASALLEQGRFAAALAEARAVLQRDPGNEEATHASPRRPKRRSWSRTRFKKAREALQEGRQRRGDRAPQARPRGQQQRAAGCWSSGARPRNDAAPRSPTVGRRFALGFESPRAGGSPRRSRP